MHKKLQKSQKWKRINWSYTDVVAPTRLKFREELEGKQTILYNFFQLHVI